MIAVAGFWYWWMPVMAQAGHFTVADFLQVLGWVTTFVIAVLGAVLTPFLRSKWKKEGKMEVTAGKQGFEVALKEEFVTRREFEKHEAKMDGVVFEIKSAINLSNAELKSLFKETMTKMEGNNASTNNRIDRRDKLLSEKIEQVAESAYQGRKGIWEKLNPCREDLKSLAAVSDVANQIEKLAEAIQPKTSDKGGKQS